MLNIKVNNSSGDVVAKTVPRKRTRLPANTASPVEKGKRQKKIIQESTNNTNDCVGKSALDALVSYTNNTTHTNCIRNSKKQKKRIPTKVNYKPALDSTIKAAKNSHNKKQMFMETLPVTLDDIKATKKYEFFEVISLDRVLPLVDSQEYIHILKWNDKFGKACAYDAKQISTTAWRHLGLSWHNYMNTVKLISPFRRDHLILETIKKLGPPRSINGIRRTFRLGDSRSRRIFFQIFYTPRVSQKRGIELPKSLILIDHNQEQQSVPAPPKNALPTLQVRDVVPVAPNQPLKRGYNMNASCGCGLQPPSLDMHINSNTRRSMLNVNVAPINIFPNACLPDTGLYRNIVVGKPVINVRENGIGVITKTTEYPMTYATNASPILVQPQPRYV